MMNRLVSNNSLPPITSNNTNSNSNNQSNHRHVLAGNGSLKQVIQHAPPTLVSVNQLNQYPNEVTMLNERVYNLQKENEDMKEEFQRMRQLIQEHFIHSNDHHPETSSLKHHTDSLLENQIRIKKLEEKVLNNEVIVSECEHQIKKSYEHIEMLSNTFQKIHRNSSSNENNNELISKDVYALKESFYQKQQENLNALEKEKEKSAVLFKEVVRLGKELENSEHRIKKSLYELNEQIHQIQQQTLTSSSISSFSSLKENHFASEMQSNQQQMDQMELQFSSLKTTLYQIKNELDIEKEERKEMINEKNQQFSTFQSSLVRLDTSMNRIIQDQIQEIETKIMKEIRHQQEQQQQLFKVSSNLSNIEKDQSNQKMEIIHSMKQMDELQNTFLHELNVVREQHQVMNKENNRRFDLLSQDLYKEINQQNQFHEGLEEEIYRHYNDLKDATASITADIQTKMYEYEDILRLEIQQRTLNDEKKQQTIEQLSSSMNSTMQTIHFQLHNEIEKLSQKVIFMQELHDKINMEMDDKINQFQFTQHKNSSDSQQNFQIQFDSFKEILQKENLSRIQEIKGLKEELEYIKDNNNKAFTNLQNLLFNVSNETKQLIEKNQSSSSHEMNILASNCQEMITSSKDDFHEEWHEFQQDVQCTLDEYVNKMKKNVNDIIHLMDKNHKEIYSIKEYKDVETCVQELVYMTIENIHGQQYKEIMTCINQMNHSNYLQRHQVEQNQTQVINLLKEEQNFKLNEIKKKLNEMKEVSVGLEHQFKEWKYEYTNEKQDDQRMMEERFHSLQNEIYGMKLQTQHFIQHNEVFICVQEMMNQIVNSMSNVVYQSNKEKDLSINIQQQHL